MSLAPTIKNWAHLWQLPVKLPLSAWAEQNISLSPEYSARTGPLKLYGWQKGILDSFSDPTVETMVLMCSTQMVKCLAVKTPLPTPSGWTTMGDVQVGDQLFDERGKPCTITAVSPVYKNHECYRITFDDGSQVVADDGHYWVVFDRLNEHALITTKEIADSYLVQRPADKGKHSFRYRIQCSKPLIAPDANLPIEPYLLGCWLGDGHSSSGNITADERDGVVDELNRAGAQCRITGHDSRKPHVLKVSVGIALKGARREATFQAKLRGLGVLNNKHIPAAYLRASEKQRRSLLQGILDTDGTALRHQSGVVLGQSNKRLAHDVVELARSLGLKPTIREKFPRAATKRYKSSWVIYFAAYQEDLPFRLKRKANLLRSRSDKRCRPTEAGRRTIVNVEKVESVPVKCVAVDSPSRLYLCGQAMIPTHNTLFLQLALAYVICEDPAPALMVQAKDDDVLTFSKERLEPMIRDCAVLNKKFSATKKDPNNTLVFKKFAGGSLSLVGAGSPGNAARRSICYAFLDEIDKYVRDIKGEGDFIDLVRERTATFASRRKIILVCSPTTKDTSRIGRAYEQSDQRKPYVLCHACGHSQVLRWSGIKWDNSRPLAERHLTARYECESCGAPWNDVERLAACDNAEWRAAKPFIGTAGFWISHLYRKRASEMVKDFLAAKDNRSSLKSFVNTNLAELWEEEGEAPEWELLRGRAEDYAYNDDAVVPKGGLFLTAFCDVQADRLECEVVAWGRGRENWSVAYYVIRAYDSQGQPLQSSRDELWRELETLLAREWKHESGSTMPIMVMGIDTGDRPKPVYEFALRHVQPAYGPAGIKVHAPRTVCPTKGSSTETLRLLAGVSKEDAARRRQGIRIVSIGTAFAKQELFDNLRLTRPEAGKAKPGYCHHPKYEEDYFRGLCSEKRVVHDNGSVTYEKIFARNEPLDCKVGNRAMAAVFGIDRFTEQHWAALERQMGIAVQAGIAPQTPAAKVEQRTAFNSGSGWIPKRDNWFRN